MAEWEYKMTNLTLLWELVCYKFINNVGFWCLLIINKY